jgi:hypothetical protein
MSEVESVASRETKEDGGKGGAEQVRLWMDAIAIASKEEEAWRKAAEKAVKVYRLGTDGDKKEIIHSTSCTRTSKRLYRRFTIPFLSPMLGGAFRMTTR